MNSINGFVSYDAYKHNNFQFMPSLAGFGGMRLDKRWFKLYKTKVGIALSNVKRQTMEEQIQSLIKGGMANVS